MAKKARTPSAPRQAQGPKPRGGTTSKPGDGRRRRSIVIGVIGAVAAVGIVAGLVIGLGGSTDSLSADGCIQNTYASQGRKHLTPDQPFKPGFEYNSFPPTSGPHVPSPGAPAIWNLYTEPIRQVSLIHNLEHGGIVVQYGSEVPPETVEQIRSWWKQDPEGLVVAPLPALGDQVSLTAWTQLLSCPGFSQEAFDAFRAQYLGQGVERFPVESLAPGSQ